MMAKSLVLGPTPKNTFTKTDNKDWLLTTTLADAIENTPPRGKVYLPDASYREMTEWSMPVNRQVEHDELIHQLEHDPRWKQIQSFMGGGFWRNFKVKYPETNEMYSRMMYVSGLLQKATEQGCNPAALELAQDHLYQGQCNCSYWHGAFGGIYLPHLRNAVYFHLLTAEAALEKALGRPEKWVEATNEDYDFDGLQEIRLANDQVAAWIAPKAGGQIYELDIRSIAHNLGATIQRRPELYHEKVRQGENENSVWTNSCSTIPGCPISWSTIFGTKTLTSNQFEHAKRWNAVILLMANTPPPFAVTQTEFKSCCPKKAMLGVSR